MSKFPQKPGLPGPRIAATVVVASLLTAVGGPHEAAALKLSLGDLFRRRTSARNKKADVEKALRQIKKKQSDALGELQYTEVALGRAERDLAYIGRKLRQTKLAFEQAKKDLAEVEGRLEDHSEALGSRLRAVYRKGSLGYLDLVFTSADFGEFVRRSYLMRQIIEYDTSLLRQIKTEKAEAEERRAELESRQAEQQKLKTQYAVRKAAVARQREKRKDAFDRICNDRRKYEQHVAALKQESLNIEAEIRRRQRVGGTGSKVTPWKGGFIRPVNGRRTSGFGYRTHPIFKTRRFHTGMDLAAPSGTTIKAAAGGKVISAGTRRGYGKTVIIDHGGGKSTVYAHCSRVLVANGQTVKQGQSIAKVGSTGISTGPHLHFEVRINGKPVNPAAYQ